MTNPGSPESPLEAAAGAAGPELVEAFKLLGNETRLAVMLALWEARTPRGDDAVSFSDLYDRVGVRDSGQFSYHLDKLTPRFVEQVDDGYELTESGFTIVQAVIAGTGFTRPTFGPTDIDKACPRCDESMRMTYEERAITYFCPNCEGVWNTSDGADQPDGYIGGGVFPPAGLEDRTPTEIAEAFNAYSTMRGLTMLSDVCPDCGGTIERTITVCEDHDASDGICGHCGGMNLGQFEFDCTVCKLSFGTAIWALMVLHPAVVAFFHEYGIEYLDDPWKMIRIGFAGDVELLSQNPMRFRITLAARGDELRVTVDEELEVVEVSETG